jgi:hypothetical protein
MRQAHAQHRHRVQQWLDRGVPAHSVYVKRARVMGAMLHRPRPPPTSWLFVRDFGRQAADFACEVLLCPPKIDAATFPQERACFRGQARTHSEC